MTGPAARPPVSEWTDEEILDALRAMQRPPAADRPEVHPDDAAESPEVAVLEEATRRGLRIDDR